MSKWSLNKKIFFIVGILIVGAMTIAFMGLGKMNEIKTSLDSIVQGPAARIGNAHVLKEFFLIQVINEKNLILEDSAEGIQTQLKRLADTDKNLKEHIVEASKISTEKGQADLNKLSELYQKWWTANTNIQKLIAENKNQEAFIISKTTQRELRLAVEELMDGIIKRNEDFMAHDTKEADDDYTTARNTMLGISALAILASILLAIVILRQINKAIGEVVATLSTGSSEVTSAAQMIASSSEELSEAATEQAASLEETSSSIAEMNSMVQKNSESAKRTSELANSSTQSAEKGKMVVREMIQAIDNISQSNDTIKTQIDESNEKIAEIVKVIGEIGNKTKVINDIVFQTKLLSFNASVEAARAGEHGKGFAVVAEEVGSLAEMSGNAAKEISEMLDGSIQKVESIVNETRTKVSGLIVDGKHKVETGTRIAQQCGTVLNEIVDNISNVTQMANEISTACHEQALGVQEITKAMNQLDQVTQMNASASQQVASSAEELSGQSESLQSAVGILTEVIHGAGSAQVDINKAPAKRVTFKQGNVVPLKKAAAKSVRPRHSKEGKAVDLNAVPSGDDPRFEEA